jgi:hypothetical protein
MPCQVYSGIFFFTVTIYDCPCLELQWFISYHWQTGNWIWPIFYTVALLLFDILQSVTAIKSLYLRVLTCLNMQKLAINFQFEFIIRNCPVIRHCLTSWSIVILTNTREGIIVKECRFECFVDRNEESVSKIRAITSFYHNKGEKYVRQPEATGKLTESGPVNSNRVWFTNVLHRYTLRHSTRLALGNNSACEWVGLNSIRLYSIWLICHQS